MKNETTMTLEAAVREHWENVCEVNASWRELTNEIGVLNLLFDEGADDLDWLASMFAEADQFEEVDFGDLYDAVEAVALTIVADPDLVASYDLERLVNIGYDPEFVAETAREAGVRDEEVDEFEDEVGLVPA